MSSDRSVRYCRRALGAVLAMVVGCALADEPAVQAVPAQDNETTIVADGGAIAADAEASTAARGFNPIEAGVRRAAAQGPDALRRYIWRTRMIYNYYYWDFAKR